MAKKTPSILIVGLNSFATALLENLMEIGVSEVGIVASNAQVSVVCKKLKVINPYSEVSHFSDPLAFSNSEILLSSYDVIIECSQDLTTRYVVNDLCCRHNKPFISIGFHDSKLQIAYFDISSGCYRCVFPEPPSPLIQNQQSKYDVIDSDVINFLSQFIIHPNIHPSILYFLN